MGILRPFDPQSTYSVHSFVMAMVAMAVKRGKAGEARFRSGAELRSFDPSLVVYMWKFCDHLPCTS